MSDIKLETVGFLHNLSKDESLRTKWRQQYDWQEYYKDGANDPVAQTLNDLGNYASDNSENKPDNLACWQEVANRVIDEFVAQWQPHVNATLLKANPADPKSTPPQLAILLGSLLFDEQTRRHFCEDREAYLKALPDNKFELSEALQQGILALTNDNNYPAGEEFITQLKAEMVDHMVNQYYKEQDNIW